MQSITSEKYENEPIVLEANNFEEKDKEVELEEEMGTLKAAHTNPKVILKTRNTTSVLCRYKSIKTKEVDNNIKRHRAKNKSNVNGLDTEHEISFNDEKDDDIVSSDSDNFLIYLSENNSQSETK